MTNLYDPTYMWYLNQSNSYTCKAEQQLPGAGESGTGELLFNGHGGSVLQDEKNSDGWW